MTSQPVVVGELRARTGLQQVLRGYLALTKPRIIELLLVTTLPAMVLADRGLPGLVTTVATLGFGAGAAGSANALNCYLDRDIDAKMARTVHRPLSTGAISPRHALVFGLALGALSVGGMLAATNALAALLTLAAIVGYVVGYTLILKRRTPSNIVWGGAAGCMPTLIGWAAVTGRLSWAPVVLFGIVFFWTPPHFWALAMRFRADYAGVGVPMLPVIAPDHVVAARVVAYSWAMVACSLLLWPVAGMSPVYAVTATGLGGLFLTRAYGLRGRVARGLPPQALKLFHDSISYLTLLFLAVALDVVVQRWLG